MNRFRNFGRRCVRPSVCDIVADARGEERILLQRDRKHAAPRRKLEAGDRFAVDQNAPRRRIEESHDERNDRALAGAARTGDRSYLTDAGLEIHAGKDWRARVVTKAHVLESYRRRGFWRDRMTAGDALLGRLTKHLEHARNRDHHVLHAAPLVGNIPRAPAHARNQRDRSLEQSQRNRDMREPCGSAAKHFRRADIHRNDISETANRVGDDAVSREHQACSASGHESVPVIASVILRFASLGAESFDGSDRRERFFDARGRERRRFALADESGVAANRRTSTPV